MRAIKMSSILIIMVSVSSSTTERKSRQRLHKTVSDGMLFFCYQFYSVQFNCFCYYLYFVQCN